jgi:hypothetical protein
MREVYAHAASVCIWLGMPPSSAGDLTCARIQDIKYDVVQQIASKADRNWWRRRWVLQEAAAATDEPVILIGSLWLPWKAFIRHCISFNMRIGPSITDRETVREISTFSTIMSTRTSFRRSLDTFNLSFLLRSTVDLHASEPHDAIYAVLGLADEEAKQVVRVDYAMSFIQLYAEVTQLLVEASSWGSEFPLDVVILSLKIESRPATVDERAIRIKLQCSASKLASTFRRFENLHSRSLCSVDQMAVFVTTDGAIGMCYSTMNDGSPGLDARSPLLKAGDRVVCLYGAGSPVLVRPLAGESDGERFRLLLPCMFMRDCECYVGQQHSAEAFQLMSFV